MSLSQRRSGVLLALEPVASHDDRQEAAKGRRPKSQSEY